MSEKHLTRRQRRAGANGSAPSADDIPMKKPDYGSKPTTKTLYDIADQRRDELLKQIDEQYPNANATNANPQKQATDPSVDEPLLEALVYSTTLSMVHFTFDILVQHQYAQEIEWGVTANKLKVIWPLLLCMAYIMHAPPIIDYPVCRQLAFLGAAIVSGCYGLWLGNMEPFLAVNIKFPPIAVVCVWTVVEMKLVYNGVFLVAVAAYAWQNGFMPY